jgi:ribonuclease BN (tRNA processing enzyme)
VISHGHPDHFSDMLMCFYARRYGGLGDPGLPVYCPPDFTDKAALLVAEEGMKVLYEDFAFTAVHDGDEFTVGPFAIEAFEMIHVGVQAFGYRIAAGGVTLAYSGDAGPASNLSELARDADLFLCEATYQESNTMFPFHLSARQAGEHAAKAGAKRLMLTHIVPTLDPAVSIAEASQVFDGPVSTADEGSVVEITA